MYISRYNSVTIPFEFETFKGKAEETALIDSGATENFIDYKTVERLRLGTKKLEQVRSLKNIDGTLNQAGSVTRCCDLVLTKGEQSEQVRFYVTNLGNDRFILGYPWLAKFNPKSTGQKQQ
jgi:hypothetical protein